MASTSEGAGKALCASAIAGPREVTAQVHVEPAKLRLSLGDPAWRLFSIFNVNDYHLLHSYHVLTTVLHTHLLHSFNIYVLIASYRAKNKAN